MFFKDLGTSANDNPGCCEMQESKNSKKRSKKNEDKNKSKKTKRSKSKRRNKVRNTDMPENHEKSQLKKVTQYKGIMPKVEEVNEDMVCDKS